MTSMERVAEKLKERMREENQYELVENEENETRRRARVLIGKYQRAQQLKEMVRQEYAGSRLEDLMNIQARSNEYGEVFHRVENFNQDFSCIGCKQHILSDLQLIHGIGPVTEEKLNAKGYHTIKDLTSHSQWRDKAISLLEAYESQPDRILDQITRMKSATDPLVLDLADWYDPEDFAILDLETMGMSHQPIILLGMGLPVRDGIQLHQYVLRDIDQEVAALHAFYEKLSQRTVIVSFNGKSFDVPYLERRLNFYGLHNTINHMHFDLLHFSRKAWGDTLLNCTLNRLEKQILDLERSIDIPSALVPEFYQSYREHENPGPLLPILEHNKHDLLSLSKLFQKVGAQLIPNEDA